MTLSHSHPEPSPARRLPRYSHCSCGHTTPGTPGHEDTSFWIGPGKAPMGSTEELTLNTRSHMRSVGRAESRPRGGLRLSDKRTGRCSWTAHVAAGWVPGQEVEGGQQPGPCPGASRPTSCSASALFRAWDHELPVTVIMYKYLPTGTSHAFRPLHELSLLPEHPPACPPGGFQEGPVPCHSLWEPSGTSDKARPLLCAPTRPSSPQAPFHQSTGLEGTGGGSPAGFMSPLSCLQVFD